MFLIQHDRWFPLNISGMTLYFVFHDCWAKNKISSLFFLRKNSHRFFVLLLTSDMVFLSVGSPLQFKLVIARLNFQFQDALSMVNCLSTILAQKPNTTREILSSGCFEESQECQFLLKERMQVPSKPLTRSERSDQKFYSFRN